MTSHKTHFLWVTPMEPTRTSVVFAATILVLMAMLPGTAGSGEPKGL